ncbi:MAG TPA: hypothetical protein DGG94_04325 [Micromonosporaceae bacterium]|nr:hypothetical protein [Micromonosporaceae bacterium]HCU49025.1 hypothetical protein [Micromonosporaceae bacterium]
MIVIQRVRVRWGADARDSRHANLRSGLPDAFTLPGVDACDVLVHDVLMDEANAYQPTTSIEYGLSAARDAGIRLDVDNDGVVIVDQLPGRQAYPIRRRTQRLFIVRKGQIGRYKANFRFTGCACAPQWYYEQWTTHITSEDHINTDVFVNCERHHDVDQRVHLYGGQNRHNRRHPRMAR